MNAYECLCSPFVSLSYLDSSTWHKYCSGDVETIIDNNQNAETWGVYMFTILCLIHVMEGGTFDE